MREGTEMAEQMPKGPERWASGELRNVPKLEKMKTTRLKCMRIPGTGEPGGLPSMGLRRVGHD